MEKLNNTIVCALIPTMHRSTEEDIFELCEKCHVDSCAVIASQCGINKVFTIDYNGYQIKVVCSDTIGVSKNRNILMRNAFGDYCFFMDDDGVLENNYKSIIIKGFKNTNATWIKFNVKIIEKSNRETNTLLTRNCRAKYGMISQYGMPGFAFDNKKYKKDQNFNETVGTPNYIFHGEDSLFIHELFKKERIFCNINLVATIIQDDSTWFKKYDDQYYITQGFLYKKMHKFLAILYVIRMYFKKQKLFQKSLVYVIKRAKIGFKLAKSQTLDQKTFSTSQLSKL